MKKTIKNLLESSTELVCIGTRYNDRTKKTEIIFESPRTVESPFKYGDVIKAKFSRYLKSY